MGNFPEYNVELKKTKANCKVTTTKHVGFSFIFKDKLVGDGQKEDVDEKQKF